MALAHQIERADNMGPTKPLAKFTDEAVIPTTLRECASPTDQVGDVLRTLHRTATDHEDLVALMAIVLGEG
jgi:hypothetical protein